jgi:hypothetical protein
MFWRAVFVLLALCLAPGAAKAACSEPINDPEFSAITEPTTQIVIEWRSNCDYDHFNFSWQTPGGQRIQLERDADKRRYILGGRLTNTVYTFGLQGCDDGCTPWITQTILTCGSRDHPCEHPRGVVRPVRIKSGGGKCLDVHAPDQLNNGARVQVWDCNGLDQQTWIRRGTSIRTKNGKCLDVHAPDQGVNGGRVQIWDCNGEPQQQWRTVGRTLRSASGKCLDVHAPDQDTNGGRVQVWDCNGERQQRWDGQSW